jgi:hypothetical protein
MALADERYGASGGASVSAATGMDTASVFHVRVEFAGAAQAPCNGLKSGVKRGMMRAYAMEAALGFRRDDAERTRLRDLLDRA